MDGDGEVRVPVHASSYENMSRCFAWYAQERHGPLTIADLGAQDVNGSYRTLAPPGARYIGLDLEPGEGVDLVLTDPYHLPLEDGSIDIVVSGQMLEHCEHFWLVFNEVARVLKGDGLAFMIAPSAGPVHRYPVDCYRFYPDSFAALASWSGLHLVHSWTDERGPWRDITGIFARTPDVARRIAPPEPAGGARQTFPAAPDAAAERMAGTRPYLDALADIHAAMRPRLYVEIGVRHGASLALATCRTVAVDPLPELPTVPETVALHRTTSDDFFFFDADSVLDEPVDLAFIDGMHLVEFVLRDFMNLERRMQPRGVIVVDDVLPNHPDQARRERTTRVWTGDVWRLRDVLAEHRPDLTLTLLDTAPTGLLLVTGLAPRNRVLWDRYNTIMRRLAETADVAPPAEVLDRKGVLPADRETVARLVRPASPRT